ncbi:hypothetical protein [Paenibacillus camerounensis]|uniref:hypothetical protein n=1 Tax=Paenibacillus camerounensis TaxID=1243663 RepID=UPI0005A8CF7A|nr:hypothetical protein [Paenibacillus camerounensis]
MNNANAERLQKTTRLVGNPLFSLVLFFVLSINRILLPGLYMDSVNPDYFAAYISNPENVPMWGYPDNFLFPLYKYPLLNSLYGGATPAYLGLFLWKIIGFNVFSIRLMHLLFGLLIIFLSYKAIYGLTKNRMLATTVSTVIGFDPTFLFAWRTQYYLQLFPLLTFIPSLVLLAKEITTLRHTGTFNKKRIFLIAILLGFSAWGYFIFVIYSFALFCVLVYYAWKNNKLWKSVSMVIPGFLLGYSPFIYAHFSIIVNQGFKGYLGSLSAMNSAYGISDQISVSILDRIQHVWNLVVHLFDGEFIGVTMLGQTPYKTAIGAIIFVVWVSLSVLTFIIKITKKIDANSVIQQKLFLFNMLTTIGIYTHLLFGVIIGQSLNYQHYIMVLPLIYVSIAGMLYGIFLSQAASESAAYLRKAIRGTSLILSLVLILFYGFHNLKMFSDLEKTGGVGYYSDSINRLADYTYNVPTDAVVAFPQWGYWMGVAAATGGNRELWSETDVEQLISDINNRPVRKDYFVVLETDQAVEGIQNISNNTKLSVVNTVEFQTRNGIPTFIVAHFQ